MTFEIRLKEQAELDFDKSDVEDSRIKMNATCKDFVTEFIDCEGEVYYSTAMKAMNCVWQNEQTIKHAGYTKVGPYWDHDAGVAGHWRYPHLRKNDE